MNKINYLESLGFVEVTEQVKSEIRANAKITKAMEYVLKQIDEYELKLVVNPEHIGEKNVIFFEWSRANYKYICEVIENKTSFTTELPQSIKEFKEIKLDAYSTLDLTKQGYRINYILECWEFFLTGNPELPHFTEIRDWGQYENYPQKYRNEFIACEN